jgi:hypothetical protein
LTLTQIRAQQQAQKQIYVDLRNDDDNPLKHRISSSSSSSLEVKVIEVVVVEEDGDDFNDVLKSHRDSIQLFLNRAFVGQQGVGSIKVSIVVVVH